MLGDVNDDSVKNQEDVDLLWHWISYPNDRPGMDINLENADVNADGTVNIGDAVLLANRISFPYNEEYLLADEEPIPPSPIGNILIITTPPDVFVGDTYYVQTEIENSGEVSDRFRVSVDGVTGNWMTLQSGESITVPTQFVAEESYGSARIHYVILESEISGIVDQLHKDVQYFTKERITYKDVCIGYDLYTEERLNGELINQRLIETNSPICDYIPPEPEPDPNPDPYTCVTCAGPDKYSGILSSTGDCIPQMLIEANAPSCASSPPPDPDPDPDPTACVTCVGANKYSGILTSGGECVPQNLIQTNAPGCASSAPPDPVPGLDNTMLYMMVGAGILLAYPMLK